MNQEILEQLRKWVRSEIEYAFAIREEDEDGYLQSAHEERNEADKLFAELGCQAYGRICEK